MTDGLTLSYLAGAVAMASGAAVWIWRGRRPSPAERERRRRAEVARLGRVAEGTVADAQDAVLYYSYSVRGVHYTTTQDVSGLLDRLPAAPALLLGPVAVKFLPRNPANSIILSENWSGFRQRTNG